ncbi:uncharacterized protein G2W53_010700 [Senna tora]|uniref:Uncharacterized protein n=1 Tax=Senna tora TaxID=362788 RepID=A0A835C9S0_9FABA|nr:uncharacterized protein G2W53_010700 [Senna tora]
MYQIPDVDGNPNGDGNLTATGSCKEKESDRGHAEGFDELGGVNLPVCVGSPWNLVEQILIIRDFLLLFVIGFLERRIGMSGI